MKRSARSRPARPVRCDRRLGVVPRDPLPISLSISGWPATSSSLLPLPTIYLFSRRTFPGCSLSSSSAIILLNFFVQTTGGIHSFLWPAYFVLASIVAVFLPMGQTLAAGERHPRHRSLQPALLRQVGPRRAAGLRGLCCLAPGRARGHLPHHPPYAQGGRTGQGQA